VNILSACGGLNRCASPSDTSYALSTGTSMATPHVAGAAAAYLSANPGASPSAVAAALSNAATQNVLPSANLLPGTPNLLLYVPPPSGAAVPWAAVAQAQFTAVNVASGR
jgi:subtilisin family serine protease